MSDSVGKISLDLEVQSDLSKQVNMLAGKIGEQLKASLQNISNTDVSKVASNISGALKTTVDKALSGINLSIESVFNAAADTVSETINITKENALAAIAEVKKSTTEMIQAIISMSKNIKLPINFPMPTSAPTPSSIPGTGQSPRAPPIPKINTGVNLEAIKSQIDNLGKSLDITNAQIENQQEKLLRLREAYDNAFNQDRKNKLQEQILKTEATISRLTATSDKTGFKLSDLDRMFNSLNESAKNAASGVEVAEEKIKKTAKMATRAGDSIKDTTKHTRNLGHTAESTGTKFGNMGNLITRSFQRVLRQVLVIGVMYKAIRGLIDYTGAALKTNNEFNSSLAQIKTNLMVAFMPIFQTILPALNALMSGIATVTAYIATFINSILGKTYEQSFNAAKGLNKAKEAMGAYGKSAKKAGQDAKNAVMSFDEINQLNLDKDSEDSGAPEMVMPTMDVSDTSAITKSMEEMASNVKGIFATIFEPFKNAWDKDGNGVIEGFKRAVEGTKETLGNFFSMLTNPSIQAFKENIARLGLGIGELGLKIYSDFILPMIDWFLGKMPGVADGLNPILEKVINIVNYLSGEGFPIVRDFLGLFLAWKAGSFIIEMTKATATVLAHTLATITSKAETLYLAGLYAKDFVVSIGLATKAIIANTIAKSKDIIETGILIALYAKDMVVSIAKSVIAWGSQAGAVIANTVALAANKVAVIATTVAIGAWNVVCGIATAATTAFSAAIAFLTSPIGLVVVAIGLLISAGVALYKNWDTVKAVATNVFGSMQSFIGGVCSSIGNFFTSMVTGIGNAIKSIPGVFQSVFSSLVGIVKAPLNSIINAINNSLGKINISIPSWVPGIGGKGFSMPKIPALANGGLVSGPTLALVGDNKNASVDPEVVTPLSKLQSMLDVSNEAVVEVLYLMLEVLNQIRDKDSSVKIGETEFGRAAINAINRVQRQAGKTLLDI